MSDAQTTSSFYQIPPLYGVTTILVVVIVASLLKKAPQMNTLVVVVIGLLVGYIFVLFMNTIFPSINATLRDFKQFIYFQYLNNQETTGYIYVYPPLLVVFIIFVILLYNRNI
jgi:xanthine/uracil permease